MVVKSLFTWAYIIHTLCPEGSFSESKLTFVTQEMQISDQSQKHRQPLRYSAEPGIPTHNLSNTGCLDFTSLVLARDVAAALQKDHRPFTVIRICKLAASDG